MDYMRDLTVKILPLLWAITIHEVFHGWVANRLGDPTARLAGRLTLNPIKHLDPFGILVFVITQMIGWAKPVPVVSRHFRDPRRGMIWVALAGPGSNFVMAVISALIFNALFPVFKTLEPAAAKSMLNPVVQMVGWSVVINTILAIFNLVPIPPLDGGRILVGVLPESSAEEYSKIEPYGFFIIFFLVILMFKGAIPNFISSVSEDFMSLFSPFLENFVSLLIR